MFNSLNGIITGKFSKKIYLQTQGIEWSIIVPESCLDEFPCVGKECKVYTWLNHTENSMDLFGFAKEEERMLFRVASFCNNSNLSLSNPLISPRSTGI